VNDEICVECFHPAHSDVCPECGRRCASDRRRRLAVGGVRVLYTIVVLLLFFALIGAVFFALSEGLSALARVAPWIVFPIGVLAMYLRYLKSQALARELDAESRRKGR
jgi:hypothetical protein